MRKNVKYVKDSLENEQTFSEFIFSLISKNGCLYPYIEKQSNNPLHGFCVEKLSKSVHKFEISAIDQINKII